MVIGNHMSLAKLSKLVICKLCEEKQLKYRMHVGNLLLLQTETRLAASGLLLYPPHPQFPFLLLTHLMVLFLFCLLFLRINRPLADYSAPDSIPQICLFISHLFLFWHFFVFLYLFLFLWFLAGLSLVSCLFSIFFLCFKESIDRWWNTLLQPPPPKFAFLLSPLFLFLVFFVFLHLFSFFCFVLLCFF